MFEKRTNPLSDPLGNGSPLGENLALSLPSGVMTTTTCVNLLNGVRIPRPFAFPCCPQVAPFLDKTGGFKL